MSGHWKTNFVVVEIKVEMCWLIVIEIKGPQSPGENGHLHTCRSWISILIAESWHSDGVYWTSKSINPYSSKAPLSISSYYTVLKLRTLAGLLQKCLLHFVMNHPSAQCIIVRVCLAVFTFPFLLNDTSYLLHVFVSHVVELQLQIWKSWECLFI